MRTGRLVYLTLTFSSIFSFTYLIYGILFILLLYRITLISLEFLVHMHLLRPHCVYQEDAHGAITLLSAGWKDKSSSQRRQISRSLAYFPYCLVEVEGIAERRRASSAYCLRMLPVSVARGQLGCPLAAWDCKMDWTACGLHARVPGGAGSEEWWSTLPGTRSPSIDSASCSLPSVRAYRLLQAARAAPARTGWMKSW